MKIMGIYVIENRIDGKCYVGSAQHILQRWSGHRNDLRCGVHTNRRLQEAYNLANDPDIFTYRILEECLLDQLAERERYWINTLDTLRNGYNIFHVSDAGRSRPKESTK